MSVRQIFGGATPNTDQFLYLAEKLASTVANEGLSWAQKYALTFEGDGSLFDQLLSTYVPVRWVLPEGGPRVAVEAYNAAVQAMARARGPSPALPSGPGAAGHKRNAALHRTRQGDKQDRRRTRCRRSEGAVMNDEQVKHAFQVLLLAYEDLDALRAALDAARAERDALREALSQSRERAAADEALIAQQHVDAMAYRDERDALRAAVGSEQVRGVLALKGQHVQTWRDKPDSFWLAGLAEEVLELTSALEGRHEHMPDTELAQIAAIALNWLELRAERCEIRVRAALARYCEVLQAQIKEDERATHPD
jgi:hypothetical protein